MIKNLKNRLQNFIEQHSTILIVAFWILMQSFLLYIYGIETGGESMKAILEAENLIKGNGLSYPSTYLYLTEIILIYLSLKIGVGFWFVLGIQLAVNLFALLYFFKFLERFTQSRLIAFAGAILVVCCVPYQQYNSFLYTESIFFSLSLVYSCFLLSCKKINVENIALIVVLVSLLCITRPSGIFFVAASFIYIFFFFFKGLSFLLKVSIFLFLFSCSLFLLNKMMGSGGRIDIMLPFKDERIICDVPTLANNADIDISKNGNSLFGLVYYVTHNFDQFSRLALLKTKAFFGLVRPYYSKLHNGLLITYFFPLYFLALVSFYRFRTRLPIEFIYLVSLISIYWLSVLFSCDEWHSRFFMTLTPFIIIIALYSLKKLKP